MSSTESITLNSDVDLENIRDRIGVGENEELRNSSRRRDYLQKFGRILTGTPLDLILHPSRAETNWKYDPPKVYIPTQPSDQTVTDYSDKIWDMLCQETITLHELGHILYTDFPALMDSFDDVEEQDMELYHKLFNVFEDAAIEAQLRGKFSVEDDFAVLYANITANEGYSTEIGDGKSVYTFHEAALTVISDMGTYDTGRGQKILDPSDHDHTFIGGQKDRLYFQQCLPRIREATVEVLSESDGGKRITIIRDFFDEYIDWVDQSEAGGRNNTNNDSDGETNRPSDIENFDDVDIDDLSEDVQDSESASDLPDEDDLRDMVSEESGRGSLVESLDDRDIQDIEENYSEEVKQEAKDAAGDTMDEIEEFHDLIQNSADTDLEDIELEVVYDGEKDWVRLEEARQKSRPLAQVLKRQLQHESLTTLKRNQRSGDIDERKMMQASQGQSRIFSRRVRGDDKEYFAIFVLDRSGSMGGETIRAAENATVSMALALEDIGAETSIMDMFRSTPRLTLPIGESVEQTSAPLFSEESKGGTPLDEIVELARNRTERMADVQPFMIVLTDGRPGNRDRYFEQLQACNFPVMGITLSLGNFSSSVDNESRYFHRHTTVETESELYQRLRQLCSEIVI